MRIDPNAQKGWWIKCGLRFWLGYLNIWLGQCDIWIGLNQYTDIHRAQARTHGFNFKWILWCSSHTYWSKVLRFPSLYTADFPLIGIRMCVCVCVSDNDCVHPTFQKPPKPTTIVCCGLKWFGLVTSPNRLRFPPAGVNGRASNYVLYCCFIEM